MDPIGTALHALDRAAEGLSIRELDRLHTLAQDIALKARQWNPENPERTATIIAEMAFDELMPADSWSFLLAAIKVEFADPQAVVRAQLKASVEDLGVKS